MEFFGGDAESAVSDCNARDSAMISESFGSQVWVSNCGPEIGLFCENSLRWTSVAEVSEVREVSTKRFSLKIRWKVSSETDPQNFQTFKFSNQRIHWIVSRQSAVFEGD